MEENTTPEIKNTLSKDERLYLNRSIDRLFSEGKSFIAYPLRIVYFLEDEENKAEQYSRILVSVSKRKFKRAVKRNRVKRLVREAYRLNKSVFWELMQDKGKRVDVAFLYLKDELPTYVEIEKAILKTASMLAQRIEDEKA